ncbi:MAG: AAA family ATPase, partial [Dysgonamonadaceae bacterium]|nr:AAA family ATPase [Dysgonamonadaceae bacterium]
MKNLPIGIQSFADLRKKGYLYVDKTKDIHKMITSGKIYFLSRPRRFGKSLLISTLKAIFKGEKKLFEGLYIYDRWDWTQQYPVIRLDFGEINCQTPEELENDLSKKLLEKARQYNIDLKRTSSGGFAELIENLYKTTGQQVVVLIDEYDKPITDHLSQLEVMIANKNILHNFYQVLKAADEYLHFVLLTGVSKFAGVSIFSALNNANDITVNEKYASICGYTQEELETYFSEYLEETAENTGLNKEDLIEEIHNWYDGYSWDGKTFVYNPYSTLLLFENKVFGNYWFRTGTPTFLVELLKKRNQLAPVFEPLVTTLTSFDSCDPVLVGEIPLLFQTGYLTIKRRELFRGLPHYTLGIPN